MCIWVGSCAMAAGSSRGPPDAGAQLRKQAKRLTETSDGLGERV